MLWFWIKCFTQKEEDGVLFPMSSWRGIAPIGSKALKGIAAMRPFLRMVGRDKT